MKQIKIYSALTTLILSSTVYALPNDGFECMIQPNQTVEIRSPIVGVLQSVTVKRGSLIKKGQTLATLESTVEQSAANTARFRTQLQGSVAAARNKLENATLKTKRMQELHAENFVSVQALDDARNEKNQADAELQSAQESLQQARFEYNQSQADLNRRVLKSPFTGIVMDQYLYPGSIVSPTDGKFPILKIAQTDELSIRAIIPFRYFKQAHIGQQVTIIPEAPFSDQVIKTKLQIVDRVIEASSGTFGAVAKIANKQLSFPSGIRCKMYLK